jgi:hypothetical protein
VKASWEVGGRLAPAAELLGLSPERVAA